MDFKKLSDVIRAKKKKLLESEPEMIGTSPTPDLNAQDVMEIEEKGRIESTLNSPHKIDARDTVMGETYDGVGLSPEEKSRMGRLRKYMDSLSIA